MINYKHSLENGLHFGIIYLDICFGFLKYKLYLNYNSGNILLSVKLDLQKVMS
jgi:hypothetical protein